jgi:hypothetical protein
MRARWRQSAGWLRSHNIPVVFDDSWKRMEAEIERQFQARLAELRSEGKTVDAQRIDPDDTSTGRPELWCIVKTAISSTSRGALDNDELVHDHMTDEDVEEFLTAHPDWVHVWALRDNIEDRVHETWED